MSTRRRDYAFGDTDRAADRLELLARVFAEPSRSLLLALAPGPVDLAVEIGCGPGWSTRLLDSELRAASLAGLDSSANFLQRARRAGIPATWYLHDATVVPFPTGPADVLWARMVLAHLADPEAVLGAWSTQLRSRGLLLVEDTEQIMVEHPLLETYEEMASALVAHHGGDLCIGRLLARGQSPADTRLVLSRAYHHRVRASDAARLFAMNFATWRRDPFIVSQRAPSALDEMASGLERLSHSGEGGTVTFVLRQVAYRRRG
jgi:trans-aconitate 2-methyltransferase